MLKKGTLIGKIYSKESIPKKVEVVSDVEEVTSMIQDFYINHEEGVQVLAPSLIVGPIFKPDYCVGGSRREHF